MPVMHPAKWTSIPRQMTIASRYEALVHVRTVRGYGPHLVRYTGQ
jgi:hypothetical protein